MEPLVLTVDVGLLNLGICLMNKSKKILYWQVIDVMERTQETCQGTLKNGNKCTLKGNHKSANGYFCKRHNTNGKLVKQKMVKSYTLEQIARILLPKLEQFLEYVQHHKDNIKKVLVELQPRINNKMKFTSHLIFGKFVECLPNARVTFESAKRKLKVYQGAEIKCNLKSAYAKRKYIATEHTKKLLETTHNNTLLEFFESQRKKDDLSDCFLMCLNGVNRL